MCSPAHVLAGIASPLQWRGAPNNVTADGLWRCADGTLPFAGQTTLHPCTSSKGGCCGGNKAGVEIEHTLSLADSRALLEVEFEVWPNCGDGLTLSLTHTRSAGTATLFTKYFEAPSENPHRESLQKFIQIVPGDLLRLRADPGNNQDCDGVFIQDIRLWASRADAA